MVLEGNRQAEEPDDAEIIARIKGGEIDAFELILARYRYFVHGIAARHVPPDRAGEIAHEVFVSAYRNLSSYSGKGGFRQWLGSIAVRRCCDFWRERERRPEIPLSQMTDNCRDWLDAVSSARSLDAFHDAVSRREAIEVLNYALDRLGAADRTVLTLVFLDGLSICEAAQLLGSSSVVVKVRVHRAKARMRKIISGLLEKGD
ncbi:MAG: sigma-70 family RNA polymerase sigma factor [Syntrophobacteraceae bacterium]